MNRKRERLCWIGGAVVAVVCGTWIGKSSQASKVNLVNDMVAHAEQSSRSGKKDGQRVDSRRSPQRDETELRKMANHALSTPRRTERFQRLMAMLDDTTADNWNTLWIENWMAAR